MLVLGSDHSRLGHQITSDRLQSHSSETRQTAKLEREVAKKVKEYLEEGRFDHSFLYLTRGGTCLYFLYMSFLIIVYV